MAKPGGWNKCVGSGHAYLVLRKGYAEQLAMAHRELGVGYVRFHGIFDDDVGVWKGRLRYFCHGSGCSGVGVGVEE